jgi:effector-binding domain-containing protein
MGTASKSAMETTLKTEPAITTLGTGRTLALEDIPKFALETTGPLYQKIQHAELQSNGPMVFLYRFAGNKTECRIAVPIKETGRDFTKETAKGEVAPFQFAKHEPFKCLAGTYKGSMKGISKGWDELMHAAQAKGLKTTPLCREVYTYWVAFDSPDNVTELQVGVE